MTSSIDTNVLVAFLDLQIDVKEVAKRVIEAARSKGDLLISGCVFAELLAGPQRTVADVEATLKSEGIGVDWEVGERVWRCAGERYQQDCARRRERGSPDEGSRRILADFLIGAHASVHGLELVTFDQRLFAVSFPEVRLRTQLS